MTLYEIARIVFALIAVLGMIGLAAIAARRIGVAGGVSGGREKRLRLVESLALDQRRRAAILSCDGREHLIILDQDGVTLIEQGLPERKAAPETNPGEPAIAVAAPRLRLVDALEKVAPRAALDAAASLRNAGAI